MTSGVFDPSAAVQAPGDWWIGTTSLSIVRASHDGEVVVVLLQVGAMAAVVLVSSPPIVCRISTPSARTAARRPSAVDPPGHFARPRSTRSSCSSADAELPIGSHQAVQDGSVFASFLSTSKCEASMVPGRGIR